MRRENVKSVITALLLALFCWHLGSVTLFPHIHVVDGVVICHSHPYSGTPDNPGHSHSSAQLDTIAQLSMLVFVLTALTGVLALFRTFTAAVCTRMRQEVTPATVHALRLRGPPCR